MKTSIENIVAFMIINDIAHMTWHYENAPEFKGLYTYTNDDIDYIMVYRTDSILSNDVLNSITICDNYKTKLDEMFSVAVTYHS